MVWSTPSTTARAPTGVNEDLGGGKFRLTVVGDSMLPAGAKMHCVRRGRDDSKKPFEGDNFKLTPDRDGWEATATFDSTTLPSGTYTCVLGTFREVFTEDMMGIPRREKIGEYVEIPALAFKLP